MDNKEGIELFEFFFPSLKTLVLAAVHRVMPQLTIEHAITRSTSRSHCMMGYPIRFSGDLPVAVCIGHFGSVGFHLRAIIYVGWCSSHVEIR